MEEEKDKTNQSNSSEGGDNSKKTNDLGLSKHFNSSEKSFVFQYKKTEKILAALYLVTNFLSDEEPLRWQLRELGLSILSNVMSLKDALPSQKDSLCGAIKTSVFEMISLLEIAHFAGFISSMNFEILKREFVFLLDSVSTTKQSLESFVLPTDFFTESVSVEQKSLTIPDPVFDQKNIKDKKYINQNLTQNNQKARVRDLQNPVKQYGKVEVKKSSRQEVILNILKKKKEIMVKDISAVIVDCSEKTLQRELLDMVTQGILKKEGERRWSKYSIA
jgi:predicted transcriptional regulator